MNKFKGILLVGILAFLSGCTGGPSLDHYKGSKPSLNLEEYFTGPIKAWGIVQDFNGNVTRRFDVDMIGIWKDGVGVLDEDFEYYDGKKEKRIWTIKRVADNNYVGTAGDIVGEAKGQVEGSAMRWAYEMDLEVDGKNYRITFDDWMFLMNDGVLINRSYLKKFGFTVAELTLVMQKQDQ